jgi:hypothetical protein
LRFQFGQDFAKPPPASKYEGARVEKRCFIATQGGQLLFRLSKKRANDLLRGLFVLLLCSKKANGWKILRRLGTHYLLNLRECERWFRRIIHLFRFRMDDLNFAVAYFGPAGIARLAPS